MYKKSKLTVKIICLIASIFILIHFVEINEMKEIILNISLPLFFLIILFIVLDRVILGLKWNILLKAFNINIPKYAPIVAYFRGKVLKLFIPTEIGVDIYKTYYIRKYGVAATHVVSSIIVERFVGMLSSLAIISLLIYFLANSFMYEHTKIATIIGLIVFVGLWLILYIILGNIVSIQRTTIPGFLPCKFKRFINDFYKAITIIKEKRKHVMRYYAISIGEKLFFGTCIFFSAKSIGLEGISYFYVISASPFLALLERIPFSISAIGIREGLFIVLFRPYDIDATTAVSVALAFRSAEMCLVFICIFFWVIKGKNDTFNQNIFNLKKEVAKYNLE